MGICCKKIYRKNINVIVLVKKQVKQINNRMNKRRINLSANARHEELKRRKKRKKLTNEPFVSTSKRMRRFCMSLCLFNLLAIGTKGDLLCPATRGSSYFLGDQRAVVLWDLLGWQAGDILANKLSRLLKKILAPLRKKFPTYTTVLFVWVLRDIMYVSMRGSNLVLCITGKKESISFLAHVGSMSYFWSSKPLLRVSPTASGSANYHCVNQHKASKFWTRVLTDGAAVNIPFIYPIINQIRHPLDSN